MVCCETWRWLCKPQSLDHSLPSLGYTPGNKKRSQERRGKKTIKATKRDREKTGVMERKRALVAGPKAASIR